MIDIQLEVLWHEYHDLTGRLLLLFKDRFWGEENFGKFSPRKFSPKFSSNSSVNSPHCCLRWPNWLELWWEIAPHNKPRNTCYSDSILCEDGNSEGLTEILPKIIRNYPQNSPPRPISRLWANPSVIPDHTHAWIMIGMGYWHRNLHSDVFIYNYPNYPFLSRWLPNASPMESIKWRKMKSK